MWDIQETYDNPELPWEWVWYSSAYGAGGGYAQTFEDACEAVLECERSLTGQMGVHKAFMGPTRAGYYAVVRCEIERRDREGYVGGRIRDRKPELPQQALLDE